MAARPDPKPFADHIVQDSRPLFVCFSHLRWNFVYQRPQHLLSRAARSYDVLYIEEPVFEPAASPRLDIARRPGGVTVVVPILPEDLPEAAAEATQRKLLDDLLLKTGQPEIVWYYTPMALPFSAHLRPRLRIYDNMDELSAFLGAPPRLLRLEAELLAAADLVFTGGISLYEAKRGRHPNVHALPSSIDMAHFACARQPGSPDPGDQATIARPRLGFFGVIDERLDVALLDAVAQLRPGWQFVMIGPVVKIDPATLPRRANIHWLGARSYDELPAYLAGWDLGIMPFAINASTRFISPTKTPEFLAAGLPVVSTPIRDVVRCYGDAGLVAIASDAAGFVAAAAALMERSRTEWLAAVDRRLADQSWDKTWNEMHALMRRKRLAGRLQEPSVGSKDMVDV